MFTFLLIIHVIICLSLIAIVLLQSGKGAEMGAAFGGVGQAQNIRSSATFISKLTTSLAILFMCTSTGLAYLSSQNSEDSVVNKIQISSEVDSQNTQVSTPVKTESTENTSEEKTSKSK